MSVDELADRLSNLTVKLNTEINKMNARTSASENENMRTVNWDIFKSKVQNIKPFDGNSNTLNTFIFKCESLLLKYATVPDEDFKQHVFECVQSKLVGKAEIMIGNRLELDNWSKLKAALIQCFSDRRDLDCLIQELTRTRPFKNEHLLSFGSRLQLLKSNVIQRISNDTCLAPLEKTCQISHYDKTALNTFIAGCSGTLRNNLYIKKPTSLEDAMACVNEFENFEMLYGSSNEQNKVYKTQNFHQKPAQQNFQNQNNFSNTTNFPHNNSNYQNNNRQQFNNQNQFNHPNQYNQFNQNVPNTNFNQKQPWPCQPINITPREMPPRRYPTNREVFGPPINVFKPKPIPPHQQSKPEPMSTTSANPSFASKKRDSQIQSYQNRQYPIPFQATGPPDFTFQELFTNDYNEDMNNYAYQDTTNTHPYEQNYNYTDYNNYDEYENQYSEEYPVHSLEEEFQQEPEYEKVVEEQKSCTRGNFRKPSQKEGKT